MPAPLDDATLIYMGGLSGRCQRQSLAAARLVAAGLAAGLVAAAGAGAGSQPPAGAATLMAASGCGSGVKVWIASLAAASDWASRRLAISSRLRPESASPWASREAEPFEGFGEVLFDADAAGIEDAEIELAVGDAAIGRLAEPLRRALVIGALAAAIGVEHGQIMHRLGVAAFGRLQVVTPRDLDVLF